MDSNARLFGIKFGWALWCLLWAIPSFSSATELADIVNFSTMNVTPLVHLGTSTKVGMPKNYLRVSSDSAVLLAGAGIEAVLGVGYVGFAVENDERREMTFLEDGKGDPVEFVHDAWRVFGNLGVGVTLGDSLWVAAGLAMGMDSYHFSVDDGSETIYIGDSRFVVMPESRASIIAEHEGIVNRFGLILRYLNRGVDVPQLGGGFEVSRLTMMFEYGLGINFGEK